MLSEPHLPARLLLHILSSCGGIYVGHLLLRLLLLLGVLHLILIHRLLLWLLIHPLLLWLLLWLQLLQLTACPSNKKLLAWLYHLVLLPSRTSIHIYDLNCLLLLLGINHLSVLLVLLLLFQRCLLLVHRLLLLLLLCDRVGWPDSRGVPHSHGVVLAVTPVLGGCGGGSS